MCRAIYREPPNRRAEHQPGFLGCATMANPDGMTFDDTRRRRICGCVEREGAAAEVRQEVRVTPDSASKPTQSGIAATQMTFP